MAKSTKAPAKVKAKAAKETPKSSSKAAPVKATTKASAKAPAKAAAKAVVAKAAPKAAPAKLEKAVATKATASKSVVSKTSAKAAPAKAAPKKAAPAKSDSAKPAPAKTSSVKAVVTPAPAKVVPAPAKASASKPAVAPPAPSRPAPVAPKAPEPIKAPPAEEFEDAFSDVPQEPEQFSPVPMASRLHRTSVRYADKDLNDFRVHIEAERKKAMEEFQILRENLDDLTNSEMADENASYSMHMAEQGTDAQEKEKLYAHVQRVSDYIKKLDEALQRIQDKVYGICKMCGILIAKERLLAVPITTQSASYKLRKRCPEDGVDRIVKR